MSHQLGKGVCAGSHPPLAAGDAPPPCSRAFAHRLLLPPSRQDFPHISEFPSGSGSRSPGPSNPTSSGDWDSSYPSAECGISTCRSAPTHPPWSRQPGGKRPGGHCSSRSSQQGEPHGRRPQERMPSKARSQGDSASLVPAPPGKPGKGRPVFTLAVFPSVLFCFHKCFHMTFMDGPVSLLSFPRSRARGRDGVPLRMRICSRRRTWRRRRCGGGWGREGA